MDRLQPCSFFDENFVVLTGNSAPYCWQRELFLRFCNADYPTEIDLPTGTGKTSIMDIWFLALTFQAQRGEITIPRRLAWIVNRRVVVDQATERASTIAEHAKDLSPHCREALKGLSLTRSEVPAISTLRGEKADNREWTKDPSRPSIIIGTVDMIGSRLLFSGYGDGAYFRPQHAGLLGVDTLVVNDEAHLTPALIHLLKGVQSRQPARRIVGKTFRYLSLSATHAGRDEQVRFPAAIDEDMAASESFHDRVTGYKRLSLHSVADSKKLDSKVLELAIGSGAARTIVYTEKPEKALEIFQKIDKLYPGRAKLLTGTMRGYERDELLRTPVLMAMLAKEPPSEQMWLVASSAGEVGIDITSEREVSSLVTADHLIQRFGRLNRFGSARGEAHVVYTAPKEKETALIKTLEYLKQLPELDGAYDIRCITLRENPPKAEAQTEAPILAELHDWLIELWCQTSHPVNKYPAVEHWLHGKEENGGPETAIAWREDVDALCCDGVSEQQRKLAVRYYRVLAHERLSEPTGRLKEKLKKIAETQPDSAKVLIQGKDRSIRPWDLKNIDEAPLDYALVLAHPRVGRLVHGMLSSDAPSGPSGLTDVADGIGAERRERWMGVLREDGDYQFSRLAASEQPVVLEDIGQELDDFVAQKGMRVVLQVPIGSPEDGGDPERVLIYLRELPEKKSNKEPVHLAPHCERVAACALSLAEILVPRLALLYEQAGLLHDSGKGRDLWQHVMGNDYPDVRIAKPIRFAKGGNGLGGYRHELGSLVDARNGEVLACDAGVRDLLLHLVASHHGHARPHFPASAHDPERVRDSEAEMALAVERFGLLTDQWGPWGLAYLEAIFKAADGLVSSQVGEPPDDEQD